jgi:hypothetical protein
MTRDEIIRRSQELRESFAVVPPGCCAEHRRHQAERFHQKLAEMDALRQMLRAINEERDACAAMCEQLGVEGYGTLAIAAAIRQRGSK